MGTLDLLSVAIMGLMLHTALALVMIQTCFTRKTYPGFQSWTLGQICWVLATAAFFMRPFIGATLSVLLSNPLYFLFAILSHRGFILFFRLGDPRRLLRFDVVMATACLAVIYWNYFAEDNTGARVAVNSLGMGILLFRSGFSALKIPRAKRVRIHPGLSLSLWLVAVLLLARAGLVVFSSQASPPPLLDPMLKLIILLGMFLMALVVYGFISLLHERLEEELLDAQARLRELADTDPLTGLLNRRGFMEIADHDIRVARRYGQPLSLILFDIDRFKAINDKFGHAAGDQVLTAIARLCREELRDVDTAARWGGEEFAVLMPQTGLDGASRMAERLRELLREVRPVAGADVSVSASFGVARMGEGGFEELADLADQCLYRAKDQGRDRVCAQA